jgi:hypothetical protein
MFAVAVVRAANRAVLRVGYEETCVVSTQPYLMSKWGVRRPEPACDLFILWAKRHEKFTKLQFCVSFSILPRLYNHPTTPAPNKKDVMKSLKLFTAIRIWPRWVSMPVELSP